MDFDLEEGLYIFEITLGYKVAESEHMTVPLIMKADDGDEAEEVVQEYLEINNLAGDFWIADITGPFEYVGVPVSLTANAIQNREHVLRMLDRLIDSLRTLRDHIQAEDADTLNQHLQSAYQGRQKWWIDRHPELRPPQANPYQKQTMSSMLFGDLFRSRRKKPDEENQK